MRGYVPQYGGLTTEPAITGAASRMQSVAQIRRGLLVSRATRPSDNSSSVCVSGGSFPSVRRRRVAASPQGANNQIVAAVNAR